jgi:hypothetical protein
MDVLYFLEERTRFIRYYYDTAAAPFVETKRRIEAQESPYDNPPYDESGEPPYLTEWIDAEDALRMVGRTCVSMLNASMQLYFQTWEKELALTWEPGDKKKAFKSGILGGYRARFQDVWEIRGPLDQLI